MLDLPTDPTTLDEIAALDPDLDHDLINLGPDETGIEGFLTITTEMGSLGPRVRYREALDDDEAPSFSVSIAMMPTVLAASMDRRVLNRLRIKVMTWVILNYEPLIRFWKDGDQMDFDEVQAMIKRIRSV